MANPVTDASKAKLYEAGDKIEHISENVGQRAGEIVSQLSGTVNDYYRDGRRFVVDNPGKGVAAAMATGIVVGSLLTLALSGRSK